jgi:hypothetical protein
METKIAVHLATCFGQPLSKIRKYFKFNNVEQWGRVCQLGGGDDMYTKALDIQTEDQRGLGEFSLSISSSNLRCLTPFRP